MSKHIFVTGGVVSSLGKGLTAASLALLLRKRGYTVSLQKLDPYINVDPGTMSPYQHGEVYVTVDGAETDLDLGHYERFTGCHCTRASNFTSGSIYSTVIRRERQGEYLGHTVQVIPHITDEIKNAIRSLATPGTDIVITEIGGTVGDIESQPFLEAIRQLRQEIGRDNGLFVHVTLVPYLRAAGELKTKPSQQSVGILRTIGIIPDMLVCRCERPMEPEHRRKLALFCNVDEELVIEEQDVRNSIYEVPCALAEQDMDVFVLERLRLHVNSLDLTDWQDMLRRTIEPRNGRVEVALVGKYMDLRDAYKSIYEALVHGGAANNVRVDIRPVEAEALESEEGRGRLDGVDGILVPGGFGVRGIEGKIHAAGFARENQIPYFGICLGMQCAVMELARHLCGLEKANSMEFDPKTPHPVVDMMEEQKRAAGLGGTMRLGAKPCRLAPDTLVAGIYGCEEIRERHRHRYEFNNHYRTIFEEQGIRIAGTAPDLDLVEIVELPGHPWYVACQFHPEFQSTPLQPHPLFAAFIGACRKVRSPSDSVDEIR